MQKTIYLSLLIISIFYACGNSRQIDASSLETISIDENDIVKEVDATFLLDTTFARMVLLELNDESLIGEVSSIYYKNNKIIIFDRQTHGVYIFNDDGSYYSKIHAVGGGPGEYNSSVDFVLATDSTIAVLCPTINKILYYNFEGKHLYDINLHGAYGNAFNTFDNRVFHLVAQWGFMPIGKYGYFCVDTQEGVVDKQLFFTDEDDKVNRGWWLYNIIYNGKDRSLAIRSTMDTIWEITPENVFRSRYYIDIVRHKMPRSVAEGNVSKALESGFSLGVKRVMEYKKYLFLNLINPSRNTVLYDKEEKKVVSISDNYSIPAWKFRVRFDDRTSFQDKYILYENPVNLDFLQEAIEYYEKLPDSRLKTETLNAFKKIEHDEMNPMICILKFKE
jgi:hypothetical protein